MKFAKKASFALVIVAAAMAGVPGAVLAKSGGTKTGGSWSSTDCNSTGCTYTYCKIDHTDANGAGYGSTGGTSCYTIFIPIYAEAPAPE